MKLVKNLIIILLSGILCPFSSFSQETNIIDSLHVLLNSTKEDTLRVQLLNDLAWEISYQDPNTAIKTSAEALSLSLKIQYKKGIGQSYHQLGGFNWAKGNYPASVKQYENAILVWEEINDKTGVAKSTSNMGGVYMQQGDYARALEVFLKTLKTFDELNDKSKIASSLSNIGLIFYYQGHLSKALEYYLQALKINEDFNDKINISINLGNIGMVYRDQHKYNKALEIFTKTLAMNKEMGNKRAMSINLYNMASLYMDFYDNDSISNSLTLNTEKGETKITPAALLDSAVSLQRLAYDIKKEIGDKYGMASSLTGLGDILFKQKKYSASLHFFKESYNLADSIGALPEKMSAAQRLYQVYKQLNDMSSALLWYESYTMHKDSIFNREKQKAMVFQETQFEFDKKILEQQKEHEKLQAISTEKTKRQKLISWSTTGGLIMVLVFAFLIFNRLKVTRQQKKVIEKQKKMVESAYTIIEDKNKDVTDSINYAKCIQEALLKEEEHISEHLPPHFVFYKPKDIISGDFYWSQEKLGHLYLAASDCTGHGVPGAMMSMLGIAFLNEITSTEQLLSPALVLDKLREKIVKELNQTGEDGENKDGMDISLVRLNLLTNTLEWAGANNPLWIIGKSLNFKTDNLKNQADIDNDGSILRNKEGYELYEIGPNKQPIGYHSNSVPFTNHIMQLEKDTSFYLFTDGFADQFGGSKGKKFKYAQLKKLFLQNNMKSMMEQKSILNSTFDKWKGDLEQVDDVCIIGVKV